MRASTRSRRVAPPRAALAAVRTGDDGNDPSVTSTGSNGEGATAASANRTIQRGAIASSGKGGHTKKAESVGKAKPMKRAKLTKKKGPIEFDEIDSRPPGKLPMMPLDILFEIFALLSPVELVKLMQTCKPIRAVLLSRKSLWAWKAARKNNPLREAPDPPSDISEPLWANLLFNGALCFNCGGKGAWRIDFMLRMRLCKKCLKAGLVNASNFKKKCPDLLPVVLDLVPCTNMSANGETQSDYYWIEDLQKMDAEVRELESSRPESVEAFFEERRSYVDVVSKSALTLEKQVSLVAHGSPWARYEAIKAHYEDLGYGYELQAHRFQYHPLVLSTALLTDEGFANIRKTLDPILSQIRKERVHDNRRYAIISRYRDYKKSLLPIQQVYLAQNGNDIARFSCFQPLLERDAALDVSEVEWIEAFHTMPDQLSRFIEARRDRYASLLPKGAYGPKRPMKFITLDSPAAELARARVELMSKFAGPLELAIATFVQPRNGGQTAYIARDFCNSWFAHSDWHFDDRSSRIVARMVRLLGLNPCETTAIEMDRLDRYFSCTTCHEQEHEKQKKAGGMLTIEGLNWRTMLWHLSCTHQDISPPISLVNLPLLSRREIPDYARGSWFCNHCMNDEAQAGTHREVAVNHLVTV
ncbi:hypothetical protein DENSPDRAFT_831934 [Dentipellis sp. KUC8613]|nr:hypothetical protein DENSPDRAFT_831934 [Dentipellis sp. KUC8613]